MSNVTTSVTTFDQIFGWLFNNPPYSADGYRLIKELAVNEIEDGAIPELKKYCQKHNLPLEIKHLKENLISIKVKV